MLVDEATIFVRAGKGGDGCVSFRREKYIPKGGPNGGDGGRGGDVVLVGDHSVDTLYGIAQRPHYRAEHGGHGLGKNCHGADGANCDVRVPLGTLVHDAADGRLIVDIETHGQRHVIARGGAGGLGNDRFKSPTNQTPRQSTPGEPGEELTLRLVLKLIADVGLIGLPNAGKSTLLRAVSRATPKVADYPFTTLSPNIGVVELPGERRLVLADIPGLIEGAADGAGLGHDFLKHIERTSVLVHVLEVAPADGSDPLENYRAIRGELARYSQSLADKPEIIALNKIDAVPEDERKSLISKLSRGLKKETSRDRQGAVVPSSSPRSPLPHGRGLTIVSTSGATCDGTRDLLEACWIALNKSAKPAWQPAS